MRHGSSNRRSRNRGGSGSGSGGGNARKVSNQKTQVFDSNGPDVRIRGTAFQVAEKYVALAKDAQGAGDFVLYQSYLQHAEHYQRMINSWEIENQSFEITDLEYESKRNNNHAKAAKEEYLATEEDEDDLGLPASILGDITQDDEMELSR